MHCPPECGDLITQPIRLCPVLVYSYAKTFLEEKLLQTKVKLEDSERELLEYVRDTQVVNVDEKQNTFSQNLQEFNTAVAKAEQDRIKAEVLYRQSQESPDSMPLVQENRTVVALKQARAKLEAEHRQDVQRINDEAERKVAKLRAPVSTGDR